VWDKKYAILRDPVVPDTEKKIPGNYPNSTSAPVVPKRERDIEIGG